MVWPIRKCRQVCTGVLALLTSVSLLVLGGVSANAANSVNVPTSANIIMPLQLTIVGSGVLSFGDFVTTNDGYGSVLIDHNTGMRWQTGGITLAGGTVSTVEMKLTGEPSHSYNFDLESPIKLRDESTGETLDVYLGYGRPTYIPETGEGTIWIDGSLENIPAHHPAGHYEGSFTVSVSYQ